MEASTGPLWIDESQLEQTVYHVTQDGDLEIVRLDNGAVSSDCDGPSAHYGHAMTSLEVRVGPEMVESNGLSCVERGRHFDALMLDEIEPLEVSPAACCPLPPSGPTLRPPSPPSDPGLDADQLTPESATATDQGPPAAPSTPPSQAHFVVVAIDFGTALSGYAFAFVRDPGSSIHMMRRWEGGDPGVVNQKTPTTLLLNPGGEFHSFGYAARDFYHDLDAEEAKRWLYFDKFKMALHYNAKLNRDTTITAANGKPFPALAVFAHALRYFRDHALQELSDQSSTCLVDSDIRWVITVPAIWKAPAKQFMRQAAIQAGMTSEGHSERLLIALEPEAASIYVRKLRLYQLVPDSPASPANWRDSVEGLRNSCLWADDGVAYSALNRRSVTLPREMSLSENGMLTPCEETVGGEVDSDGARYMVVDCGGGTVDITVHEMNATHGRLHEIYKATGGPYGSVGVDAEFERLLSSIFGQDFIDSYKQKRPSGWVDLMIAFESRKRSANPLKNHPLNICLPFSFIEQFKKYRGQQVENAINKFGDKDVRWSSQGMIRLSLDAMKRLFQPVVDHIKQAIADVINTVPDLGFMFLVGGFAESPLLQQEIRVAFGRKLKILIPQDVALTVLKGAVCFGLDPTIVSLRRSALTYGVEVLNRFNANKHPPSRRTTKDGIDWCTGVFDKFVTANQEVSLGETIVRRYAPATSDQSQIIINIYCTDKPDAQFVTDDDVTRCGRLRLDMSPTGSGSDDVTVSTRGRRRRREVEASMTFGDTEIGVSALDVSAGTCVRASVDFLDDL